MRLATLALAVWSSVAAPESRWQKVYEATGPRGWIADIRAIGRDDLFVAGEWGVTRITAHGVERHETGDRGIVRLFADGADDVFAVGVGDVILHFDGRSWAEEHVGPHPDRPMGSKRDLLHTVFFRSDTPRSTMVAVGPEHVLERRDDGSWSAPPERERERLFLASVGDPLPAPGCHGGPWFWLGKSRAWFACDDLRTFSYDRGTITPTGKRPASCRSLSGATMSNGESYIACGDGHLWAVRGQSWQPMSRPDDQSPDRDREYGAISAAGKCVFLAGRRTVWKRCDP